MTETSPATVTTSELRDNLAAYQGAAEAGQTITIVRRGKPSVIGAAVQEPAALEVAAFRESLGVRVEPGAVVRMRRGEAGEKLESEPATRSSSFVQITLPNSKLI